MGPSGVGAAGVDRSLMGLLERFRAAVALATHAADAARPVGRLA
jgi:hypothetical protein